ncbi:26503_t:CDS:2, partial [Gigaspora margarita]
RSAKKKSTNEQEESCNKANSQNTTIKSRSSPSFVWEYFQKEDIEIIIGDEKNVEGRRTDPFQWRNLKKTGFLILSKIARKYSCVSATSVSSERLFSDGGNNITAKSTNLDPEL